MGFKMNPTEPELICKVIPENRKKNSTMAPGASGSLSSPAVLRVTDLVVR